MRCHEPRPLTCRDCRHFIDDPDALERELPGLTALSSARGSSRGDSGICVPRQSFQRPITACRDFEPRGPTAPPDRGHR